MPAEFVPTHRRFDAWRGEWEEVQEVRLDGLKAVVDEVTKVVIERRNGVRFIDERASLERLSSKTETPQVADWK